MATLSFRLASDIEVRLSPIPMLDVAKLGAAGASRVTDFTIYTSIGRQEFSLSHSWRELMNSNAPIEVCAGNQLVRLGAADLTTLEREGWLMLLDAGQVPTVWTPPRQ